MNKADVCINHTTAVSFGSESTAYKKRDTKLKKFVRGKNSPSFDKLLSYLDKPTSTDMSLEHFPVGNIGNHATTIYSFVKDSKRYVWYNNPWGHKLENQSWLDESFNIGITDGSVEDLKRQNLAVPPYIPRPMLYHLNARRVSRYTETLPYDQVRIIYDKYTSWNKGQGPAFNPHHPLKLLYLLKLLTNATHLEILHPNDTMPPNGPQTTDGVDKDLPKSNTGACGLWVCMYTAKVEDLVGGQLRNPRRDIDGILRTIKESLSSKSLHGQVSDGKGRPARCVLARGVEDYQFSIQALLAMVYDVVPGKDLVETSMVTSRKRKRTISSGWHTMVFRKLDEMMKIIERESNKRFLPKSYSTHTYDQVHARYKDSMIAGYIETLAIVSGEDETNKGMTYLDKTAHIATFVWKNHLDQDFHLQYFVVATKNLIACKHNDDPENDHIPRKEYAELTTPTRLTRANHDRVLRERHSKMFNYNLAERQRGIENRKRAD